MDTCFLPIKRKIQILVLSLNFISFIVIILLTNNKKDNYIEYTTLPKSILNFYILLIFIISLIHSIYPKLLCSFLSKNLSIITKDSGKLIINLAIGILYYSCDNSPQLVFSIINFVSSFGLFLCEFIFQCRILKSGNFDTENRDDKYINSKNNFDTNQKY